MIKKSNVREREITKEIIDLSIGWAKDEITLADFTRALGSINATHSYTTLARALKAHIKNQPAP